MAYMDLAQLQAMGLQNIGSQIREFSIEIQITDTLGIYFLPDAQLLRNRTVIGLYFWEGADISPNSGRALLSKNGQENSFITLMSGNKALYMGSPLAGFGVGDGQKVIRYTYLDDFTPSESFIKMDPSIAGGEEDASIYLTFIYLD